MRKLLSQNCWSHAADLHAGQADLCGLIGAVDRQRLGLPTLESFAGRPELALGMNPSSWTVASVTLSVAEKEPAP